MHFLTALNLCGIASCSSFWTSEIVDYPVCLHMFYTCAFFQLIFCSSILGKICSCSTFHSRATPYLLRPTFPTTPSHQLSTSISALWRKRKVQRVFLPKKCFKKTPGTSARSSSFWTTLIKRLKRLLCTRPITKGSLNCVSQRSRLGALSNAVRKFVWAAFQEIVAFSRRLSCVYCKNTCWKEQSRSPR